jgi:hypothetical protein
LGKIKPLKLESFISSSVTLLIGIVAGFIAYQQWKLARQKLKLDLFEKRYKVYDATRKFLSVILRDANFTDKDLFEYYASTSDSVFLFEEDLVLYLRLLSKRALNMRLYQVKFLPLPVGEERNSLVQKNHDELVWLMDQFNELAPRFSPYLGFTDLRGNSFFDRLDRYANPSGKYNVL